MPQVIKAFTWCHNMSTRVPQNTLWRWNILLMQQKKKKVSEEPEVVLFMLPISSHFSSSNFSLLSAAIKSLLEFLSIPWLLCHMFQLSSPFCSTWFLQWNFRIICNLSFDKIHTFSLIALEIWPEWVKDLPQDTFFSSLICDRSKHEARISRNAHSCACAPCEVARDSIWPPGSSTVFLPASFLPQCRWPWGCHPSDPPHPSSGNPDRLLNLPLSWHSSTIRLLLSEKGTISQHCKVKHGWRAMGVWYETQWCLPTYQHYPWSWHILATVLYFWIISISLA